MLVQTKRDVHGLLLLDKPKGISSNNILQKVKFIFHAKKAGYVGTLDPLATGVLPICFGEATKFSCYLTNSNKKYHVIAKLGETTSTSDSFGMLLQKFPVVFNAVKLTSVLSEFIGKIKQIPSMYSAIKHKGIPLYKYARQGININRSTRIITIYKIYEVHKKENFLEFKVICSKGTYIRTLVEDLGNKLGCGAHVVFLRRLSVSLYSDKKLIQLSYLHQLINCKNIKNTSLFSTLDALLMPVESAVLCFPMVSISIQEAYYFKLGQSLHFYSNIKNSLVRVMEENKKFIGLGKINTESKLFPYRLICL